MNEGRQTLWPPPFMSVWLVYQSAWCAVSGRLDQLLLSGADADLFWLVGFGNLPMQKDRQNPVDKLRVTANFQ